MWSLEADTIRDEVEQILDILNRWKERLANGIPGDDIVSNEENAEIFKYRLVGELKLAAGRLAAVIEVLE